MELLVTYKGFTNGGATHVNHVFESDGGRRYEWYTNSDKLDHVERGRKLSLSAVLDEMVDDIIYIKYVNIKEVI